MDKLLANERCDTRGKCGVWFLQRQMGRRYFMIFCAFNKICNI